MTTVPKEINAAAAKKNSAEKLTPMMQQRIFPMSETQYYFKATPKVTPLGLRWA